VKANRYLTHIKRLKVDQEALERFLGRARRLGDRLGPILWQLPPRRGSASRRRPPARAPVGAGTKPARRNLA